ncbi:MAG: portal protein, partial [Janthinobacterium lividum]
NMKKAIQTSGEVWLSMAKDILVEEKRQIKTVGKDGQVASVQLLKPGYNKETGEVTTENDIGAAKFDVVSDVGPSSSSRRAATVRAITGLLQMTTDPEMVSILGAIALANMEGEGMSEVREYSRKQLVRKGVYEPTEEDKAEMQQEQASAQPSAQDQYLQAAAQKQMADAKKTQSDSAFNEAKTDESHANAIAKLATVDLAQNQHVMDSIQTLHTMENTAPPALPASAPQQPVDQQNQ